MIWGSAFPFPFSVTFIRRPLLGGWWGRRYNYLHMFHVLCGPYQSWEMWRIHFFWKSPILMLPGVHDSEI